MNNLTDEELAKQWTNPDVDLMELAEELSKRLLKRTDALEKIYVITEENDIV